MASEVEGADLNSVVARLDVEGALLDAEDVGNEDAVEVDVANEGGAEAPKPSSSMEVEGAAEAAEEPAKGARNGSAKRVPFRRRLGRGPGRANGPPTPNGKPTLTIRARGKVLEMDGHFVWISNLPYDTTWKELKDVIRKKGALPLIPDPRPRSPGLRRRFGAESPALMYSKTIVILFMATLRSTGLEISKLTIEMLL